MIRLALSALAASVIATGAFAQDAAETRAEIEAMFGTTPGFLAAIPDTVLPGLWRQTKDLEFSSDTALDPKTKALISLAVAAQIPCSYCIWMDTNTARSNGATDDEIAEAVAVAGLTRNWSTVFYGTQVDLAEFKKALGGS